MNGIFQEYDDKRYGNISRRYLGLIVVPTTVPRDRAEDIYSTEHIPLEEDGMKFFLPEKCGRVPTIESVHPFLTDYIRSWLWKMSGRPCLSSLFRGSISQLEQPLGDLIRLGEGSRDRSFDRLARLRAVVSPNPRSDEFFLKCEDDLLESILQTSISRNRIVLIIFWLIAAFRCGFEEELLAVVCARLELVWQFCVTLQDSTLLISTEVEDLAGGQLEASNKELELLWMAVCEGLQRARESHRGRDRSQRSPLYQARSLALFKFVDGFVDRKFSERVKRAAFDSH